MQNIAILTQSHKAIAAKKKAKREQIKEIVFDDAARREFLTGFHKRKVAKADAARKKAVEREKQERQETRREQRRMLREQAVKNAAEVESAYHALIGNSNAEVDDEWTGISTSDKGKKKEEEYEDEEVTATVTIVEDFDPDTFIYGSRTINDTEKLEPSSSTTPPVKSSTQEHQSVLRKKVKSQKVRYQTKDERKAERTKQRARRTEKAELAGGKASRKKSGRRNSKRFGHGTPAMNSLYTSGVRQTNSLQADLERLRNGDNSAPLLGQISASLAAMHRTIDDYDSMAKREIIKAKQEKAQMRVQKFRADYTELRNQFDILKSQAAIEVRSFHSDPLSTTALTSLSQKAATQRADLMATSGALASPSDTRRRFQNTPSQMTTLHPGLRPEPEQHSESPFRGPSPQLGHVSREFRALDEHSFIQNTESRLDEFLAQGREVLDNLVDQRNMLKGTQRRLLDAANTLGMSRDLLRAMTLPKQEILVVKQSIPDVSE
ncbi:hypothetical protein C0992_013199 [Termitomyces sp. T32_za158]|nr:hypothetical protein C0992_013199 [Termitomyces sp. T32_za158]